MIIRTEMDWIINEKISVMPHIHKTVAIPQEIQTERENIKG